ncbi:DMT family transporter [Salsipaludibacter albus]|uniref:DMT family transporter n=1 Tax=Salsipaludibacter albus TaxID=2849650 RepID=UPI001EE49ADE|nr:DMT family transporter [Salsipaludibacter albus]MBY5161994.1 DMT family transporter [Salsipaludibacter albus]
MTIGAAVPASRSSFSPGDAGLLALLALMWGNSFLFIKFAVATIPPAWIVAGRLTVGGSLLVVIALVRRRSLPRAPRDVATLAVIGLAGAALPWAGQAWAQQFLDSGLLAVLNATTPGATLVIAVAVGQERLHRLRVLGLLVAAVGSVVIVGGEISQGGPVAALVVAAVAPFAYGIGTVLTRARVSGRIDPLPAAAVQLSTAAVVATGLSVGFVGPPPPPLSLDPVAAGSLVALGVVGTGLAFLLYFTLIQRVGATNASMVTYLVPVVGLVAGAVVRGERFGPNVLLGAAILVVGVWLAQRRPPDVDGGRPPTARTIPPS